MPCEQTKEDKNRNTEAFTIQLGLAILILDTANHHLHGPLPDCRQPGKYVRWSIGDKSLTSTAIWITISPMLRSIAICVLLLLYVEFSGLFLTAVRRVIPVPPVSDW